MRRLVALFAVGLLITQAAPAQTFKIATLLPDGTQWMVSMRAAAKTIEQRTEGRVSFRFYPGGVMGNDKSVLRKIRLGQLHGGALTGGGLADIYPDTNVYGLPFIFQSYEEVDYVRERIDPKILQGIEEKGFISFGLGETGFAYLMSDSPIRSTTELKSKKVWIPEGDEISRSALAAIGVTPVSLPLTDVLTGLQTGLIDTVATSPIGAIALQWHARVRYVTDFPLMYLLGTMVIDKRRFERLSAEDQRITREVMMQLFEKLNRESRAGNREARAALHQQGLTFVSPSGDEEEGWQEGVQDAVDALAQRGEFSPQMLEEVRSHLRTFRHGH